MGSWNLRLSIVLPNRRGKEGPAKLTSIHFPTDVLLKFNLLEAQYIFKCLKYLNE